MDSTPNDKIHVRLAAHESQCEERWKTVFVRLEHIEIKMDKLQGLLLTATGTVVVFLCGIIVTLIR